MSDFASGIAAFSGTKEDPEQHGFIDLNGKILLTFRGANLNAEFNGFDKNGRVGVYVHDLSGEYGNPVPKIYGYVDCTGKVTLEQRRKQ